MNRCVKCGTMQEAQDEPHPCPGAPIDAPDVATSVRVTAALRAYLASEKNKLGTHLTEAVLGIADTIDTLAETIGQLRADNARLTRERDAARAALADALRHSRRLAESLETHPLAVHPLDEVPRFPSPARMESPL